MHVTETAEGAWVVGEALMDLIQRADGPNEAHVGGGPANTAKALARMGYSVSFLGGISNDEYGKKIDEELRASGVDLRLAFRTQLPTALAVAEIDKAGGARYTFELDNRSSFAFHRTWLPEGEPRVIHLGSLATIHEPGASELLAWVKSKNVPVIFDPNVRPSVQGDREKYRLAVDEWIKISSVIKLSEDDINWLYGSESVITEWLARGVALIVVTRGANGISAYRNGEALDLPAEKVDVIDTVGAGDTIGAVIVGGILDHGVENLHGELLHEILKKATRAAGITCSRAGAQPPWADELI